MKIVYRALLWTLIFCYHTRSQDEKCDSALGMKNKAIPDESITSSSNLDSNHEAKHGRGRFERENKEAWCSAEEDAEPYIQIKFVEEKAITAVKTQGSSTDLIYSRKYKVMYLDGGAWTPYKEELFGNNNFRSIKMNTFHPAIRTKSIRIYPKEPFALFHPGRKVVCVRLELYGCSAPAGCNDPGSPTNGERIGDNFDHGSRVSFSCRQGFVQVGNSTSVCHRGSWSNAPPQCKATCKDPGIPKNGNRKGSNFIDGDSVEFHCNQNYSLFGAPIVRCLEGRWSATLPECKASCGDPGIPLNGDRVGSDFGHGKHLQFVCKSGFWLVGSQLIVCSEGKWSNDIPKCKAVCSDPGIPSNGNRIGDDFGDGQIVAYMCNVNFTLVGARTVFCLAGQWNATKPTCKASCSDPGIPHRGRRIGSHFGHGSQVTFVCLPKYSLLGSQSMTCHDGRWSSIIPVCKAYCKDPGSPQNGVRHGNEFTHSKRISFTCLPGYKLTGSASAVCINGKWSAAVPRCKAICPDPGIPVNGSRIGNSFLDGQTVAFRCQQSYTLVGSHILRCEAGKWNNKLPECKAPCLNPPGPPNGRILNARPINLHGARVRFACKTGFQIEGPINIKCVDGNWTSDGPSCKDIDECTSDTSNCHENAVCKNTPGSYTCTCKRNSVGDGRTCLKLCANPGVPPHGARKGNKFQHGRRVAFTCEVGYRLVGSSSLTCLEGEWSSALPQCKKNCADPGFPLNGFTRGSNFQHGEKVTFVCQPGFKLTGITSTTCNDGAWSDKVPVCRALCKDPGIPLHGSRTGNDFEDGKTVNFTCNVGYTLFGRNTIECHKGIWSSALPQCKITCPEPANINHGFFLGSDYSDGNTITYLCDDQYVLDGSSNTTCVDGRWKGSPPVCRAPCPVPVAPANGNVFGENHQHRAVIQYWCKQGFVLHGAISNECVDGKWNTSIPSCKEQPPPRSCQRPAVPANARMLGTQADKEWFTDGDRVFYRCQTGYAPSGFAIRRCKNGVWSSLAFRCNAKSCGHPGTPVNGELNSYVFTYNSIAQYLCNQGYTLVGSPERVCQANQTWSGILPQCTPIHCGALPTPMNGEKVTESTVLSGQVTFRCLGVQYKLVGSSTRTCLEMGQWSGQQPSCNLIVCDDPGTPLNGERIIISGGFSYTGSLEFRCINNYKLDGVRRIFCKRDGNWSRPLPRCLAPCPNPGTPQNGRRTGNNFEHTETVHFYCKKNYRLVGSEQLTCNNGRWSSATPICRRKRRN